MTKNLLSGNDTIVKMIEYEPQNQTPDWILERAQRMVDKVGGTVENAIDVVKRSQEAWQNAEIADPNEPFRAIINFSPPNSAQTRID